MKIGVIGVGYVGLVSGVCFSDFGHTVICFDNNEKKIEKLRKCQSPIFEPGLTDLIKKNVSSKRLFFETEVSNFINNLDVIFVAVGTPSRHLDGKADLTDIFNVFEKLAKLIKPKQVIVIKSTVPVGTNSKITELVSRKLNRNIELVSNPEFLREGSAIEDFMKPNRVIIGVKSTEAKKILSQVYKPLYLRDFPIMYTDPESAELIKYASNAFLATKISFINEVAALCEKVDADVKEVAKGMGLDKRIGDKFLHAGPGFGGSCFPKDTLAFSRIGQEFGTPQLITEAVIKVNNLVKERMKEKIMSICDGRMEGKVIVFLGVTFKPNTDDIREAPSLKIIPFVLSQGAKVRVVDPQGRTEGEKLLENVDWFDDVYLAVQKSDLIVILTEWNEFRALDLKRISKKMSSPRLADLRNIYSADQVLKEGFDRYIGVGRKDLNL